MHSTFTDFKFFPYHLSIKIFDICFSVYICDFHHNRLIDLCQRIKNKVEADRKKPCRMCLVEGPETAYYFEEDEINFNESIPSGGTLLTQGNEILAMNVPHYIN
jgi:hypothetical protein